ncbi:response regulator transcription factor [Nocardia sp. SYP-A9097]|uniref:LuxR C-terminal-related transcriptional regulator n=1 Tax=Nocardia sp. SYP-A9097 TaxID=2663237 RepID=UPI001890C6F5|nr:response regulator transcription factor [Nocardia sp. SYP-A9097]
MGRRTLSRHSAIGGRYCPAPATRHTLVVASDSPYIHDDFEQALDSADSLVLAGTSSCREVVDKALRWRPDVVLLDASVAPLPGLPAIVRRLRSMAHPPLAALLVQRGAARVEIEHADVVLAADFGVPAVLRALQLVASGVMVAAAPTTRPPLTSYLADPDAHQRLSSLTAREREILLLIVGGLSNREVGARLYMSPDTVKEHVSRILTKLEVASRIEAAVAAVRAELEVRS